MIATNNFNSKRTSKIKVLEEIQGAVVNWNGFSKGSLLGRKL
jgi:hypothetical protein